MHRSTVLRLGLVALAGGLSSACYQGLSSLAPFPCTSDYACPTGFVCTQTALTGAPDFQVANYQCLTITSDAGLGSDGMAPPSPDATQGVDAHVGDAQTDASSCSVAPPSSAVSTCPAGTVLVAGGSYIFSETSEEVTVSSFCLDQTVVTVADYLACSEGGRCSAAGTSEYWPGHSRADQCNAQPEYEGSRQNHPINCVTFVQAEAYCAAQGKRVPLEVEYEWASRNGPSATSYPWGSEAPSENPNLVCWYFNDGETNGYTCPVGSYPEGNTTNGIEDLDGDVYEMLATSEPGTYVERGGGYWDNTGSGMITTATTTPGSACSGLALEDVGFRCAVSLTGGSVDGGEDDGGVVDNGAELGSFLMTQTCSGSTGTATLSISVNGYDITIERSPLSNPNTCSYSGTFNSDCSSASGTYTCDTLGFGSGTWSANVFGAEVTNVDGG